VGSEAADRRVHEGNIFFAGGAGQPIGDERVDRTHVHDRHAGARMREHAAGARDHGFDDRRVRQHRDDDVARRRHVSDAGLRVSTERGEQLDGLGDDVVYDERSLCGRGSTPSACPCCQVREPIVAIGAFRLKVIPKARAALDQARH
jgi:hypothetical protein